jgi:hypothetical protein
MTFNAHRIAIATALVLSAALAPAASAADDSPTLSRIGLDGNRITVTAGCKAPAPIHVHAAGRRIGTTVADCRKRTARARFTVNPIMRKRLTGAGTMSVEVRVGKERTTVGFSARSAKASSNEPFWSRMRANCTQLSHGNPPYSLFTIRDVAIEQAGEQFGYRVSTPITFRGLFWVYEPNGTQYWVTTPWNNTFAGTFGTGTNLSLNASAWVRPAVQLYNGAWGYVNVSMAQGATAYQPNWCFFPVGR